MPENQTIEIKRADWAPKCPAIFAECVTDRYSRFDLSRPYVVEGYLYATDARIAVRMPTPATWDLPNPEKAYGKVGDVFGDADQGAARLLVDVPEVAEPCSWCGGGGTSPAVKCICPSCDQDIDLPARRCEGCSGTMVDRPGERVEVVPGYWIARGYAALLRRHGIPSLMIPEGLDHKNPALFRAGPIEGRVMPMTPPGED